MWKRSDRTQQPNSILKRVRSYLQLLPPSEEEEEITGPTAQMMFQVRILSTNYGYHHPSPLPLSSLIGPGSWSKLQLHSVKVHQLRKSPKALAYYGLTTPPFELDALEPYMSQRSLEIHWGKHHRDYVDRLNKQIGNSPLYGHTLEELVKVSYNNGNPFQEFNSAAQLWNHDFFWESLQPGGGKMPWGGVLDQIEKDFGSFSNFREEFLSESMSLFGSGWVWLFLKRKDKKLAVTKTSNAVNPLVWGDIPILALDMWEHAYYHDYKNDRGKYVNTFLTHLVSWHSAAARMARAEAFVNLGEPKIPVA